MARGTEVVISSGVMGVKLLCNWIDSAWGRYVLKQKTEPIEETSCVVQEHLDYKLTDMLTTD